MPFIWNNTWSRWWPVPYIPHTSSNWNSRVAFQGESYLMEYISICVSYLCITCSRPPGKSFTQGFIWLKKDEYPQEGLIIIRGLLKAALSRYHCYSYFKMRDSVNRSLKKYNRDNFSNHIYFCCHYLTSRIKLRTAQWISKNSLVMWYSKVLQIRS